MISSRRPPIACCTANAAVKFLAAWCGGLRDRRVTLRVRLLELGPPLRQLAVFKLGDPEAAPYLVESVRGVDCDGPIRTLMARGLVEEVGRAPVIGRPSLFATTVKFLEYFGLERPDDLPPLPPGLGQHDEDELEEAEI